MAPVPTAVGSAVAAESAAHSGSVPTAVGKYAIMSTKKHNMMVARCRRMSRHCSRAAEGPALEITVIMVCDPKVMSSPMRQQSHRTAIQPEYVATRNDSSDETRTPGIGSCVSVALLHCARCVLG